MVLGGFHVFQGQKVCQRVAACGSLKTGAATPLTNLCSDAGVGRLVGYMGWRWYYMVLLGFRWFLVD